MIRKTVLILALMLLIGNISYANGGPTSDLGSMDSIIIPQKSENISVIHESLTYDIRLENQPEKYAPFIADVTAKYEMENQGNTDERVKIAFPFDRGGDASVRFDGELIEYQVLTLSGADDVSYPKKNEKYKWDKIGLLSFDEILAGVNKSNLDAYHDTSSYGSLSLIYFEVEFKKGMKHELLVNYQSNPSLVRDMLFLYNYTDWTPYFHYYLEPASYWKSFGSLDVEIHIPEGYEISNISLSGMKEVEPYKYSGYYNTLPENQLIFALDKKRGFRSLILWGVAALAAIYLSLYKVIHNKEV